MPRKGLLAGALLALLIVFSAVARAQWSTLTFDETNPLTGVWFFDDSNGIVVGENTSLFLMRSGGTSFSRGSPPLGFDRTKCCHSVHFLNRDVGWVGGNLSALRTLNGGSTFAGVTVLGSTSSRIGISAVSDTTGWQTGGSSYYRHTISLSGTSYSGSSGGISAGSGTLRDLHMFNEDSGLFVGDSGRIVRMSNGSTTSRSFALVPTPTSNSLKAIFMLDANTGWIVGGAGTILKTENGGNSWSLQSSGTVNDLYDVHFRNASIGWAVGNAGLILVTLNGGASWSPEASGTSNDLRGVFAAPNNVYAVGLRGTFLKRAPLSMLVGGVSPDRGPTLGGTPVTITGIGFKSGATVTFGEALATSVNVTSSTTITAVTPFHGSGSVDVVVKNSDNTTATLPRGFLYQGGRHGRPARR